MSGPDQPTRAAGPARGTKARAAHASPAAKKKPAGAGSKAAPTARSGSRGSRRSGSSVAARPLDPDRLAALEEERDFLLRSLRDLEAEHEAGDVDDGDYAALNDDYTARAAAVIRTIEGERAERVASRPPRSLTRRIVVGAVVTLFAVGTGVLMAQWSGTRGAGDTITGGIRSDTRDELLAARQAFSQNPPQYLQAIKDYDEVLKIDPANVEALAYKGWMYRLVSLQATGTQRQQLQAEALASLKLALATSPKDATSLVFTAALLDDLGQPRPALADLDAVPAGQIPDVVTGLVSQLRAHLESELGPSTGPSTSTTTAAAPTTTG